MTEPEREKISGEVKMAQEGTGGGDGKPEGRHCAICGEQVNMSGQAIERFGEAFCSEAHAEEFVKAVRAARIQAAAATSATEIQRPACAMEGVPNQRDWKSYLGKALCWGGPLLAVVVLLGGGGALLGAANALLPFLLLLACPLGMWFMMHGMSKMGDKENPGDKGRDK